MKSLLEESLHNALSGMRAGPASLLKAIGFYAGEDRDDSKSIEGELLKRISVGPNDEVRKLLNQHLGRWDWEANAPWTGSTEQSTPGRRSRIYDLLQVDMNLRAALDEHIPPYQGAKAVVIDDPKALRDWYTFDFRRKHDFYWSKLREFLEKTRGIDPDGVNSIEASADRILERLGDPAGSEIYRARGLVVGYVQSGKTTSFTAVIAKAIDAGYRLIIVLSGTTNLLRDQTQRRLDMELVGVENILRGVSDSDLEHDYVEDAAWPEKFISYGKQPSLLGHVDIHRLTTQEDFKKKSGGLNPLEFDFEKRDKRRPLYERENLDHTGARIAVIKKNHDTLRNFISELKAVGKEKCADVPTLVIDDESDQASINTANPDKTANLERSRINHRIVKILELLPRAQYLGYTATPFANVFVNPHDPADIYPKDFIVSLPRPDGYMGAKEFLDFEMHIPGKMRNTEACIRDIPKRDFPQDDQLLEAMDAFVLTGAIKKFRENCGEPEFKHHTMLFHHTVITDDQEAAMKRINLLWKKAGYDSPGAAPARLQALLEDDFRKVWLERGKSVGQRLPSDYRELRPFVGLARDEIRSGGSPVLMVNSADGADVPNFDGKTGVWKIIVGGAKLSRGYTIEGLTISYFRRRSRMHDTLMQMGRWFGYRPGYMDLVRVYMGRAEPDGKSTIDLLKAFDAMCRDEEDFRAQLAVYEGKGGITPRQVPALVFNSYPRLRPTSKNKMFKAEITWAAFDYREPTGQAASKTGRENNAKLFGRFISKLNVKTSKVELSESGSQSFSVKWAVASKADLLSVLDNVAWEKAKNPQVSNPIKAQIGFLRQKSAPVDSWLIVAPQITAGKAPPWTVGREQFECVARTRLASSGRFGVFSSPEHLNFAKWLVGGSDKTFISALKPRSRTGVLLFYPTRELLDGGKVAGGIPVMGFGIVLPKTGGTGQRIAYSVRI